MANLKEIIVIELTPAHKAFTKPQDAITAMRPAKLNKLQNLQVLENMRRM
jgi:hypothetical protein